MLKAACSIQGTGVRRENFQEPRHDMPARADEIRSLDVSQTILPKFVKTPPVHSRHLVGPGQTWRSLPQGASACMSACDSRKRSNRAMHLELLNLEAMGVLNRSTPDWRGTLPTPTPTSRRRLARCSAGSLTSVRKRVGPRQPAERNLRGAKRLQVRIYGSSAPTLMGACTTGRLEVPHHGIEAALLGMPTRTATTSPQVLNGSTPADLCTPRDGGCHWLASLTNAAAPVASCRRMAAT